MKKLLLSVIIPVYNVEKYLRECLDSVVNQSFNNLEIICIDDCSTDNSRAILEEYQKIDSRIIILNNDNNLGLGLTRNVGLKFATGDFVHFIDSDDYLEKDAYLRLVNYINNLEFIPDILVFEYKDINDITKEITEHKFHNFDILNRNLNPIQEPKTLDNWDRYAWQKLHRRLFLVENNIIYNDYRCYEDVEQAALVYTKAKSICYVDEFILYYRTSRIGSLLNNQYKYFDTVINSYNTNVKLYEKLPEDIKYKLLGFDFYFLRQNIVSTYLHFKLNFIQLLKLLKRYNTKEVDNYKYEYLLPYEKTLKLSNSDIIKLVIKKHFPILTKSYFDTKKLIRNFFK